MNKYLLSVALFAVVCALIVCNCDGKPAAKKRGLKAEKINMEVVRNKIRTNLDARKKRAIETPADKIRSKRSKAGLTNVDIASMVKNVVPEVQNIEKKLTRRNKRSLKARLVNKLERSSISSSRKTRSAGKLPTLNKAQMKGKLSKIAKNINKFHKK